MYTPPQDDVLLMNGSQDDDFRIRIHDDTVAEAVRLQEVIVSSTATVNHLYRQLSLMLRIPQELLLIDWRTPALLSPPLGTTPLSSIKVYILGFEHHIRCQRLPTPESCDSIAYCDRCHLLRHVRRAICMSCIADDSMIAGLALPTSMNSRSLCSSQEMPAQHAKPQHFEAAAVIPDGFITGEPTAAFSLPVAASAEHASVYAARQHQVPMPSTPPTSTARSPLDRTRSPRPAKARTRSPSQNLYVCATPILSSPRGSGLSTTASDIPTSTAPARAQLQNVADDARPCSDEHLRAASSWFLPPEQRGPHDVEEQLCRQLDDHDAWFKEALEGFAKLSPTPRQEELL